jgi:hypothetical protein
VGALDIQFALVATGGVEPSVTIYPATPTLSDAVKEVIPTVNEVDVSGMLNNVTIGGMESATVIVMTLLCPPTLPAESFAHA